MKLIETFLINFFSLISLLQHHKRKNYLFGQRHLEPRFPPFAWCLQIQKNNMITHKKRNREKQKEKRKRQRETVQADVKVRFHYSTHQVQE